MRKLPRIIDRPPATLDKALHFLEKKYTLIGTAFVVALLLMLAAMLYVRPALFPSSHGIFYAQLAEHPFQPTNPNAHRLLTPLVAYLVGLRGDRIIILNLLVALVLLAVVYYHTRREGYAPCLSLLTTTMLALTMPTLFTIYYGGYTDSTSYLLILLMLICAGRPALFWLLFLLGLLNRESVVFLLPFFALWHAYRLDSRPVFLRSLLAGTLSTCALYLLFRVLLESTPATAHSGAFYFGPLLQDPLYWLRQVARAYPLGLFSAFKLFWALPAAALFLAMRERRYTLAALVLTPILCSAAQSLIALDTSRMLAMSFPSLLVSIIPLREKLGDRRLAGLMILITLLNLALPQIYVTSNEVTQMRSSYSSPSGGSTPALTRQSTVFSVTVTTDNFLLNGKVVHMSRNPNTEPPQPGDPLPQPGEPEPPPITPGDPIVPDPSQPEPLPLPPDSQPTPPAPVREPDAQPQPAGDPVTGEPTRLL
jgi:hypothetical protein